MGFFSKLKKNLFDDLLGLDPGGGGIYKVARDVLGDKVADDILGMDPTGKGAVKFYNTAIPLAAGYYGAEALGLTGTPGSAFEAANAGASAMTDLGAFELANAGASAMTDLGAFELANAGAGANAVNLLAPPAVNALAPPVVVPPGGAPPVVVAPPVVAPPVVTPPVVTPPGVIPPIAQIAAPVIAGLVGADAAKSAAETQAQSAREANELLYKMYQEQKGLQEPFRGAGITAQNRLLDLLGLSQNKGAEGFGKYGRDFSMSDFTADPGYAFRLAEGQKTLDRQAAARGGLISGGALKAATRYGQDMGSQEYQNAFNRYQTNRSNQLQPLGSLLSSGQAAASNQAAAAGNYGTQAGGNITGAGAATAAGQVGSVNALTNALSSYLNYSSGQNLADAIRKSTYGPA